MAPKVKQFMPRGTEMSAPFSVAIPPIVVTPNDDVIPWGGTRGNVRGTLHHTAWRTSIFHLADSFVSITCQIFVVLYVRIVCMGPTKEQRASHCPQLHILPSTPTDWTVSHSKNPDRYNFVTHKPANTAILADSLLSPLPTLSIYIWATGNMWDCFWSASYFFLLHVQMGNLSVFLPACQL